MSNPHQLVQKLWNYCNILRDDGLSYGDYVEQLTFLLFLIMAEVERRLSVVEELESGVSANLQRATRLRQSILQKAFTGGLCESDEIHHHQERHAS
jgi:type I restriction-modification system DNA methylase subunit